MNSQMIETIEHRMMTHLDAHQQKILHDQKQMTTTIRMLTKCFLPQSVSKDVLKKQYATMTLQSGTY